MADFPIKTTGRKPRKPPEVCRAHRLYDPWLSRITVVALASGLLFSLIGIFVLAWWRVDIPPALTGLAGVLAGALTTTSLPSVPGRPAPPSTPPATPPSP